MIALSGLHTGEPFTAETMQASIDRLIAIGIFANVRCRRYVTDATCPSGVDVTIPIDEGPQYRMGSVSAAGVSESDAKKLVLAWPLKAGPQPEHGVRRRRHPHRGQIAGTDLTCSGIRMTPYPGRWEGHAVTTRASASVVVRGQSLFTFTPLSRLEQAGELVNAIQRLSLSRSLNDIQEIVRTAARRLTGADGATLVLRDGLHCYYADEDAISPLWKGERFPMQKCISGWAILNRKAVVIEDIYKDERIPHDVYRPTFVKSLAMVPIRMLDPVGAIGNYWAVTHRPRPEDVELLQALADSTAVAIENVRIYAALEDARLETLQRLALAAEYRDDSTSEHTERVARTAVLLARQLGRPPAEVALYRLAAPLHDIGKLAVSDALLLKPGKLTSDETRQMKRHTEAGAAILSGSTSDVLRLASEIALSHHEWWDGSGYPKGLKGLDIPLSGRIVAIADVFDALAHARPYKAAWPLADAVAEIHRLSGIQFDPQIVDAFRALDAEQLVGSLRADRPAGAG